MSKEVKGVQELFFPNENFRENAQFPNVLKSMGELNFTNAVEELGKLEEKNKKDYRVLIEVIKNYAENKEPDFNNIIKEDFSIYKNVAELGFYFQEMLAKNNVENKDIERYADLLQKLSIVCFPRIQKDAEAYPNNSVSGETWMDGACIDVWNDFLADYFDSQKDYKGLYNSRIIQSRMVFAIKNHYAHEIARSTFNVGVANEKLGQTEIAAECFMAIINDFLEILDEPIDYFLGSAESLYEFYYLEQSLLHYSNLKGKPEKIESDLIRLVVLKVELEAKLKSRENA